VLRPITSQNHTGDNRIVTTLQESSGHSTCQQINPIERFDILGLLIHTLSLLEGGAVTLLLNLDARSVLAKGWRCPVKDHLNDDVVYAELGSLAQLSQ
jgi:hypothetical protein